MKSKIFIFLFIIALTIIGYFAYPILKSRYFSANQSGDEPQDIFIPMDNAENKPPEIDLMKGPNVNSTSPENPDLEKFLSGEKTEIPEPVSSINTNERNATGKSLARITTEHCDNDCQAFAIDAELLEYCQQVCGFAPIKNVSDCDEEKNIEKDYCLKGLAVTKKDVSLCEPIKDANIKLTCQNRITEDLIESQTK